MPCQLVRLCLFLVLVGTINARLYPLKPEIGPRPFSFLDVKIWTDWINADQYGYIGEFENVARVEYAEKKGNNKKCLLPCKKPALTDVRMTNQSRETSNWILNNCLNLAVDWDGKEQNGYAKTAYEWFQEGGFFCLGFDQRKANSKCKTNPECANLMGPRCNCPDVEVRFACKQKDVEKYCESKGLPKFEQPKSGINQVQVRNLDKSSPDTMDNLQDYLQDLKDEALYKRKLNEGQTEHNEQSSKPDPKKMEKMDEKDEKSENGGNTEERLLMALLNKKFDLS